MSIFFLPDRDSSLLSSWSFRLTPFKCVTTQGRLFCVRRPSSQHVGSAVGTSSAGSGNSRCLGATHSPIRALVSRILILLRTRSESSRHGGYHVTVLRVLQYWCTCEHYSQNVYPESYLLNSSRERSSLLNSTGIFVLILFVFHSYWHNIHLCNRSQNPIPLL